MSNLRLESLGRRQLLSGVEFGDLNSLAQNYNSSPALILQPLDGSVAADWTLPQAIAGNVALTSDPFGNLTNKGKLTITMQGYNNARIFMEGRTTTVWINNVSRHGEGHTQEIVTRSFKNVKSIEVIGSDGEDSITLGKGLRFTSVHAGKGDDTIRGSDGESMLYGGDGDDEIFGGGNSDSLYGESGNDRLWGETGDDRLDGGAGKDRLNGGKGRNKLAGGSGRDYITVRVSKDKTDHDSKDKLTDLA